MVGVDLPNTNLTSNDIRILAALFDPETLPSSVSRQKDASTIDPNLPSHPTLSTPQLTTLETEQNALVKEISNSSQISEIENAIHREDEIIRQFPAYPSAYTNRAMLLRMRIEAKIHAKEEDATSNTSAPSPSSSPTLFIQAPDSEISALFADLSHAINLSLPSFSPSTPRVSPYQARILRTAFSHRAYLYLKAAQTGVELNGKGKAELEELASADFAAAARYGDEVAREMSVRTNPYAKMCGAIVRNALMDERREAGMM